MPFLSATLFPKQSGSTGARELIEKNTCFIMILLEIWVAALYPTFCGTDTEELEMSKRDSHFLFLELLPGGRALLFNLHTRLKVIQMKNKAKLKLTIRL